MSGIFDQIINYSPPLIVSGTVNYDGTWDASTNTPTLNNPPAGSTKGDYYVVSVAGTQFSLSFAVGDWIISNGTAWEKVDLTDAVSSVFGRTGAVVGVSTDYSAVGLTNTAIGASSPSTGAFTSLSSSSTTTLNGTTIPTSSTLLVSGGALGTPSSGTLTSCTGLPISTGVSGLGTGVATALAVNTGSAGAPVLFNGALGTPTSGTVTNLTGTASININGTVGATTPSTVAATTATTTGNVGIRMVPDADLPLVITSSSTVAAGRGSLRISGANNTERVELQSTSSNGILGYTFGGTIASPTATTNGQTLVFIGGGGYDNTPSLVQTKGIIVIAATENFTTTAQGTAITFGATPNGSTTRSTAATITSTGLNSTAIGATTASTGSFTTLSAITSGGLSQLTLGDTSSGGYSAVKLMAGSGKYNWIVGAQYNVNNALEITPSTATGGSTFSTPVVSILQTGNVGIGTTSPLTKLTVSGGSITRIISANGTTASPVEDAVLTLATASADRGTGIYWVNTFTDNSAQSIRFKTTSAANTTSTAMTIDSSGNVGIGTASPTAKLHVDSGTQKLVKSVSVNSSTQTIVTNSTEGVSGLCWIRDASVGGQALVLWDISHGLTIVSQLGSIFTTSSPSATEIQLSVGGTSPYYVQAIAGATRNGDSLSTSAINNQ